MKLVGVLSLALLAGALPAVAASTDDALKDAKLRFHYADTRAAANFRAAESIEARLGDRRMTLHPQLIVLRLRIEAALNESYKALGDGDLATAEEILARADAWIDRFASKIGGY